LQLRENVPLGPLTTLQVGGPARYLVDAASPDDVREAVDFSGSRELPLFILGGGSNVVVADSGWPGLILRMAIGGIAEEGPGQFNVGAGEAWDHFVEVAVMKNYAGIECLSGIPGTVGGTPIQNVGAYGQDVSKTIVSVHALDLDTGRFCDIPKADCGFKYRASIFNTSAAGRYVVLRVIYQLNAGGEPMIAYADLQKRFGKQATLPTLAETREAVREIRRGKGMLIEAEQAESYHDNRSAGSFFKNPVVSLELYQELASKYGAQMPKWWGGLNLMKLSAAWLIEQAGFPKGYARGAVGISSKHTLAIINRGGATSKQIVELKNEIVARVEERFGVTLQPEPIFLGKD
jgi:UDP-N-acetylmuramate dehydrogenase